MKYKVTKHVNPQNKSEALKFYPTPVYSGAKSTDEIAEEISHSTSLTPADTKAVLEEMAARFAQDLSRGIKLKLNGIGSFRLSFGGTGHENEEDVTAFDIGGIRIVFVADPKLRQKILASLTFEKVKQEKKKRRL